MQSGRVVADAKVARGLYVRAVGYDRTVEREVILGGELKPVTSTVHYPPNVQACIFWLRNRRRRTWRDPGRDAPTIRRAKSTTSPCSMPPARACATMTVIEFPALFESCSSEPRASSRPQVQ